MQLTIILVRSQKSIPGNFNVERSGELLFIPEDVATMLEQLSIYTVEEFLSYIFSFPSQIAITLKWDIEDVYKARDVLVEQLRGVVNEVFLNPTLSPPHPYGALPPHSPKKKRKGQ